MVNRSKKKSTKVGKKIKIKVMVKDEMVQANPVNKKKMQALGYWLTRTLVVVARLWQRGP